MTDTAEKLICEYIAAYRARNTMNDPPDVSYSGGWFTLKTPRMPSRKYRRHALEAMRNNLIRQTEQAALTASNPT